MRHVPEEVRRAIERMSTPLHPSWGAVARGATAAADAHSMAVIRAFVLGDDPPAPADDAKEARYRHECMVNVTGPCQYKECPVGAATSEPAEGYPQRWKFPGVPVDPQPAAGAPASQGPICSYPNCECDGFAVRCPLQNAAGVTAVAPTPTKACPECGGEGICYRTQALDDCTACNGTGRVPDGVKEGGDA